MLTTDRNIFKKTDHDIEKPVRTKTVEGSFPVISIKKKQYCPIMVHRITSLDSATQAGKRNVTKNTIVVSRGLYF